MKKVRILTDSGADFPKPYPANLTVLPLSIRFGEEEYLDSVTIDTDTFYRKLMAAKELPKTSLISPAVFEAAFDAAEQADEEVVAVLLSGKLSGTVQSAVLAADGRENVHVVDSSNATLGEQLLVCYALRLAESGMNAAQIASELERAKTHIQLQGVPDTLEYLHKGGRISKAVALVGGALSIKPILELVDGVVTMTGKARGAKAVASSLIGIVQRLGGVNFDMPCCLGYTGLSDDALRKFVADSQILWEGHTLPICAVGPTIGTHVGPNAIVVAFFDKTV